jgi:lipopolysaccharide transport system permease protein
LRTISPESGDSLLDDCRTLLAYRELLLTWTIREVKVRYKQSLLGIAWAVLQPLALMIMFSLVFTVFVKVPSDGIPYPIFSYTALLPWTFFTTAVTFGSSSIINNMSLVTKVYLPREILPLAAVGAAGVDFMVASLLFVAMALFYTVHFSLSLLVLPLLILVQLLLTVGIVFVTAATTVRFRDVRFVVPLAMQLWMYATPIIYPLSLVPERWRWLYLMNPMAVVVEGYRDVILRGRLPDAMSLALAGALAALVCVAGYLYFKRSEAVFADIM